MKATTQKAYEMANQAVFMAARAIHSGSKTQNPAQSAMARIANAAKLAEEAENVAETAAAKKRAAEAVKRVEEYKAATVAYFGI